MGKIAFIFSGQGSQYTGMGKSLYENSPAAQGVFDMAAQIRPDILDLCFNGSAEALSRTVNTQPCLFCVSLSAARALEEIGIGADIAAGFSLGEMSALAFTAALPDENMLRLVCERANAMDKASREHPGSMAAVLKLPIDTVKQICGEFDNVYLVNDNCPGQIVAAGTDDEISSFIIRIAEAGGKSVPLKVSGAFHTPFMEYARIRLRNILDKENIQSPKIPLYSNLTASPYSGNMRKLISDHCCSPVRWRESIINMYAAGADTFIEVGAGKALSGFVSKILRGQPHRVFSVQDFKTLTDIKEIKNELINQ